MATQQSMDNLSLPANADLSTKQYFFVNLANSSGEARVAVAGAGEFVVGVLQNKPSAAGQVASVAAKKGAITKVSAGGDITAGNAVTPDSAGEAVVAGTGDVIAGYALNSASDGDIVEIFLV